MNLSSFLVCMLSFSLLHSFCDSSCLESQGMQAGQSMVLSRAHSCDVGGDSWLLQQEDVGWSGQMGFSCKAMMSIISLMVSV